MALNLEKFFISETFGFAVENPLAVLPPYFEAWNRLAANMSQLLASGMMRQHVDELPVLDWKRLTGHRQKRLARLQLVLIASGYVWQNGEKQASKTLPASLAVPLMGLSRELGLEPIASHADLALANYTVIDPSKPPSLENLRAMYYPPGGEEANWFFVVTIMVELIFAKSLKSVLSVLDGVESGDESLVISSLCHIEQVVRDMQEMCSHMHDKLSSRTFFNELRPFLGGWGGENNPLPDGLIFEGVSGEPVKAAGSSAAQSSTMQVLDALLGVQHTQDKKSFLMEMREHIPPAHQSFIEAIENHQSNLPSFVKSSPNENLYKAYNSVVQAIVDFRSYHIQIVTKYIVQAASKSKQEEGNKFESLDNKGTGGTSVLPFLKSLRADTKSHIIHHRTSLSSDDGDRM